MDATSPLPVPLRRALTAIGLLVVFIAAASVIQPMRSTAASGDAPEGDAAPIATPAYSVEVLPGDGAPRFNVYGLDGETIAEGVDEAGLRRVAPGVDVDSILGAFAGIGAEDSAF